MKIDRIRMDIDKKLAGVIPSVQWDDNMRFIHINIVNGSEAFDLTGYSVKVAGLKPDGTSFFNDVRVVNAQEGFIEVVLTEQMNAAAGSVRCEVKIYSEKGVISTQPFILYVETSVTNKDITSSNEFGALTEALNKITNMDNKFESLTADTVAKATEKEIQKQIANGTMANLAIANNSLQGTKLRDYTITQSKLKRHLVHYNIFSQKGPINFVFNSQERTLSMELPSYVYACIGSNYIQLNGPNSRTVTLDYPTQHDGVTTIWCRPSTQEFKLLNFRDYATADIVGADDTILLASVSIANRSINGNMQYTIGGKLPYNGNVLDIHKHIKHHSLDHNVIDRKLQLAHLCSLGVSPNFDVDSSSKIVTLTLGSFPHLIVGASYVDVSNKIDNKDTNHIYEIPFPSPNHQGINFFVYNMDGKQFEIYNYSQVADLQASNDKCFILGTITLQGGAPKVNMYGTYTVNGGIANDTQKPYIYFNKPLRYVDRILYVPSFYVRARTELDGKYITPQSCGLTGDYFTFEIPQGYVADVIVIKYKLLQQFMSSINSNVTPFEVATMGRMPSHDDRDIIVATSIYGNITTQYPIVYTKEGDEEEIAGWASLNGGMLNFDFKNGMIEIPSPYAFIQYRNKYWNIDRSNLTEDNKLPIQDKQDGLQWLLFNLTDKKLYTARYTGDSLPNLLAKNILIIATFWANNKNHVQMLGPYKVNGRLFGMEESDEVFRLDNSKLILPPKLFIVQGDELQIYKSSITPLYKRINTYKLSCIADKNSRVKVDTIEDSYDLIESKLPASLRFGITQFTSNKLYAKDVVIEKCAIENIKKKNPTIIHIGDSITNRGIAYWNNFFLQLKNVNAKFVGTMTNQGNMRGEGREGWRYSNYVGQHNVYLNNGKPIHPQLSGNNSTLEQNPFIRLANDTDKQEHPNWCFRNTGAAKELSYAEDSNKTGDFYIFDFAHYLTAHDIDSPDVVTIALSTNDINTLNWWKDSCTLGLDIMYKQIRKALPNAQIGIIPSPAWGMGRAQWEDRVVEWIETCIKQVKSYNDQKLNIVPIWCHMNREWIFPMDAGKPISDTNDTKEYSITDTVHLHNFGEKQYGHAMYSYTMNMLK